MLSCNIKAYAKVLVDMSFASENQDDFIISIRNLKNVIVENQELIKILSSRLISKKERKEILTLSFDKLISQDVIYLIFILLDSDHIVYLVRILMKFLRMENKLLSTKFVKVFSAFPLTKQELTNIEKILNVKYNSKIEIVNKIEKKYIAGIRIEVESDVYDGTVSGKLSALKKNISSNSKLE